MDDGATDLDESLAMARMAVADGFGTVIVTPHQLGTYRHNTGEAIRSATARLQQTLQKANIPLRLLPGADVRIDEDMLRRIIDGDVLTLADRRKHVLLELPHELFFPLDTILAKLHSRGITGILSHPERNQGILQRRQVVHELVDQGCLMQVTAGSLTGSMGPACAAFGQWMLQEGLVHFVATDAHGAQRRRPRLSAACQLVAQLTDEETAKALCVDNPRCVAEGQPVAGGRRMTRTKSRGWFRSKKAG